MWGRPAAGTVATGVLCVQMQAPCLENPEQNAAVMGSKEISPQRSFSPCALGWGSVGLLHAYAKTVTCGVCKLLILKRLR